VVIELGVSTLLTSRKASNAMVPSGWLLSTVASQKQKQSEWCEAVHAIRAKAARVLGVGRGVGPGRLSRGGAY